MFYRGRRLRNKKVPRNLIKENRLSVEQLISPIFVVAGNLLTDINMSGMDIDEAAEKAQKKALELIGNMR